MMRILVICLWVMCMSGMLSSSFALAECHEHNGDAPDFDKHRELSFLSMEELMDVRITSVARKEQSVGHSAAAVFVLSKDDIRRSGATTIMDALRLVPGLEVARNSSYSYAISARGFNGTFATKLLVMIDGRSVYSPLFSGVFWSSQDVLIEDIERIEVVRGPGASMWGSNAVNGVINIITSHAKDSQGLLLSARGGVEERAGITARYGSRIGENGFYRAYVKGKDRDSTIERDDSDGAISDDRNDALDAHKYAQGGFRADLKLSESSDYTIQGDVYISNQKDSYQHFSTEHPFSSLVKQVNVDSGVNLLQRYTKKLFQDSDVAFQVYYDRIEKQAANADMNVNVLDVDFQHRFPLNARHDLVWGGGYRAMYDYMYVGQQSRIDGDPTRAWGSLAQLFVQDEIEMIPESLFFAIGARLERNRFTGVEFQPNMSIVYRISSEQSLWASVARAARTPGRANIDGEIDLDIDTEIAPLPVLITMMGNEDFQSEILRSHEVGYRSKLSDTLSFDVSVFYNDYKRLLSMILLDPLFVRDAENPYYWQQLQFSNGAIAQTLGGELVVDWRPLDWVRLLGWCSILDMSVNLDNTTPDKETNGETFDSGGLDPDYQLSLRAQLSLPHDFELDVMGRFVDELADLKVDAYTDIDVRLAWLPTDAWEFSIIGQNLLHDSKSEFREFLELETSGKIQRIVYAQATYRLN